MAKQLRHPFISEFYECFSDDNYYYLVEEYAENGSIHDYITANGRLTEIQARRYFSQIILVLEYLHNDKYIAHRDLNTNNILLDRNCNVRVTSFGFSNIFTNQTPDLKTVCGLPAYASPEMIKGNSYTKSTDIWSSGIILYFLVTGNLPFEDENTQRLLQKIVYTDIRYPSFLSIPLVDLLKKLLLKDPEKRLTLEGIKEHIWFSQCEYNVIEQFKANYDSQSNVIDKEIVQKMSEDGVDCSLFNETLNEIDESNEYLILYKQLLRQKDDGLNERLNCAARQLQKGKCRKEGSCFLTQAIVITTRRTFAARCYQIKAPACSDSLQQIRSSSK
ncbi:CAMK family protein kinase [Histomonas meleagridis]|nr:CAMK family protein kinase [Histomonas meleagridis]